jgi:hypothetical protein
MKRTASPSDLEVKNPPFKGLLERFWKWRYQTRAQNELQLLLDLDGSDVDWVADSALRSPASAIHDACAPSGLLLWQFEGQLSRAKHTANPKRWLL